MNWINIETKTLRAPEYIGADPVQRATWLNLLGYCSEQENGGVIDSAKDWKDRRWMQTCGVTLSEVETESELWAWAGESLVLWNYPVTKESEVKLKREGGKRGGEASGEARREAMLEASGEAMLEGVLEAELERKGKERKGKRIEKEGKEKGNNCAFDEFWSLYPRKESKKKAMEAWNKESPNLDQVKKALAWQVASTAWSGGFIPHPSTYLNQRRFEDEPSHATSPETNTQPKGFFDGYARQ